MVPFRRVCLVPAVVGALGLLPSAALGQGVTIDPGSPTGKEYAIPVEQARREAAVGSRTDPIAPSDRSAPLFGQGVTRDTRSSSGGDAAGTSGGGSGTGGSGTTSGDQPAGTSPLGQISPRPVNAGTSAAPLALAAGGLGVLVLGGVAGLALRRRRRTD
jgi:hypothetical protein